MSEQGVLFANTQHGNLVVPAAARLHTRATDPETSKAAARRVVRSGRADTSLALFRLLLTSSGPLTVRQAAGRTSRPDYYYLEFNRRVHAWHAAGHIELTGETRDGGRVWRIA